MSSRLIEFSSFVRFRWGADSTGKNLRPSQVIQFAGITLNSLKQKACLPEDKLQKCRKLLESFSKRRKVTLRELQYLIGLLNFACSVIVPGFLFFAA